MTGGSGFIFPVKAGLSHLTQEVPEWLFAPNLNLLEIVLDQFLPEFKLVAVVVIGDLFINTSEFAYNLSWMSSYQAILA
ncbi:hypothetical protein QQP08_002697 [Theobroma cacao]|nr:hypothetical protein QQP08_002697 [Theobroma cacao]